MRSARNVYCAYNATRASRFFCDSAAMKRPAAEDWACEAFSGRRRLRSADEPVVASGVAGAGGMTAARLVGRALGVVAEGMSV